MIEEKNIRSLTGLEKLFKEIFHGIKISHALNKYF